MKFACNVKLSTYRLVVKKRGLTVSRIRGANFSEANFQGANFSEANFRGVDFQGVDFFKANFRGADFQGVAFQRANFSGADFFGAYFREANFSGADFFGAVGTGNNIIAIQTPVWHIVIYSNRMQIGCENHSILEWMKFKDDAIETMDSRALQFWKIYKPIIKNQIKAINKTKRLK